MARLPWRGSFIPYVGEFSFATPSYTELTCSDSPSMPFNVASSSHSARVDALSGILPSGNTETRSPDGANGSARSRRTMTRSVQSGLRREQAPNKADSSHADRNRDRRHNIPDRHSKDPGRHNSDSRSTLGAGSLRSRLRSDLPPRP